MRAFNTMSALNIPRLAAALESRLASAANSSRCSYRGPPYSQRICSYARRTASSWQHQLRLQIDNNSRPAPSRMKGAAMRTFAARADMNEKSMMQGTMDKVASAMAEEAQKVREGLLAPDYLNEKEKKIFEKLDMELKPLKLEVQDISGGCGSMYGIEIVSEKFQGLSMLKQQRLVNKVLGEDIMEWHGVQLKTKVPS